MANLKLREMLKTHGGKTAEGSQVPFSALFFDPAKDKRIVLGDIEQLADNMAKMGFRKDRPLLVQINEKEKKFEVKDGRRRFRALSLAIEKHGFDPNALIPITVEESKSEADFLISTIISNDDQAKPFEPMEEGAYFLMLSEELPEAERMHPEEIAKRINKSITWVRDRIALAKVDPELKKDMEKYMTSGTITATALTKIAKIKDPEEQKKLWKEITTSHSAAVNESVNVAPETPTVGNSKPTEPKTTTIRIRDVNKAKGKSESISMKNAKANLAFCQEMEKKTGADMYKFGIKLIMALIKNEHVRDSKSK